MSFGEMYQSTLEDLMMKRSAQVLGKENSPFTFTDCQNKIFFRDCPNLNARG
jgi:hypothetical protein